MLGGVCVIIGLYIVLWGKAKDDEEISLIKQQKNDETTFSTHVSDHSSCVLDLGEPFLPKFGTDLE